MLNQILSSKLPLVNNSSLNENPSQTILHYFNVQKPQDHLQSMNY